MHIAFVDLVPWDYTPLTPDVAPLGGTQSAVCYLARQLAADGFEVSLINGATRPETIAGVSVAPLSTAGAERALADCQVAVLISTAHAVRKIKALLKPGTPLVLWTQHAPDQPAVRPLAEPEVAALIDRFVFVSQWQQATYLKSFCLPDERCQVLRNAVGPALAGMFADGQAAMAAKPGPPRLAYTSTPFRGLDTLLDVFPAIRSQVPGVTLEIYSSMQVYHLPPGRDTADYGHLYRRAAMTEGVQYVGSLPQPKLAQAMRSIDVLAYPNHFAETSCIAAMEALAAGCRVVTSDLAALGETTAGFAALLAPSDDRAEYGRRFVAAVVEVLTARASDPAAVRQHLDRQLAYVASQCVWPQRARQWAQWLAHIV
ncbi:MAG TPA: glycosyltransferase family 4 protein [Pirellulales bacterium]|jgi:glycosyltransferase involved in cell wall biosynthesis|nr:glycosyltransferase family 4 protein [Pirellulales bacterium]